MKLLPILCAVMLALPLSAGDGEAPVPEVRLVDLDGERVAPLAGPGVAATVFVFVRTDCPISNRYAPELRRIHEAFAGRSVKIWLVYPDPDEPVDAIRKHLEDYGYPFTALRDPRHDLVKLTGARITPEAVVFSAAGEQVYRGRIDDRHVDFGKARPAATVHDLEDALRSVLAGRPVPDATTRAVGCFIPPLK